MWPSVRTPAGGVGESASYTRVGESISYAPITAQVTWLVLAVLVALLFASALPGFLERAAGLIPDRAAALGAVGLTPLAYATWLALTNASTAVVYAVVGGLLVWRRPTDRLAVFAAFSLLLFGGITFTDLGSSVVQANPSLQLPYALLDLLGRV